MQPVNPQGTPGTILPGLPLQYSLGLPGQYTTLPQVKAQALLPGQVAETFPASDVVTEVSLAAYKHVNINVDYQVNPYTWQTGKTEIILQYHPDPGKVVNLAYRYPRRHSQGLRRFVRLADRGSLERRGALGVFAV